MALLQVCVFSPWLVSLLAVFPVDRRGKNWQHFFHFSTSFLPNTIRLFPSYALARGLRNGAPNSTLPVSLTPGKVWRSAPGLRTRDAEKKRGENREVPVELPRNRLLRHPAGRKSGIRPVDTTPGTTFLRKLDLQVTFTALLLLLLPLLPLTRGATVNTSVQFGVRNGTGGRLV